MYGVYTSVMGKINDNLLSLIGNTPIVKVNDVYVKLEYYNPTGSHKDRAALFMMKDAVKNNNDGPFIEYTSGNTGISVAFVSKLMGYDAIILVPENISKTKINLMKLLGAQVVLVSEGTDGHELAKRIANENNGLFLNQGENMANFKAHYNTTAPEILQNVPDIKCFVMGVGTGGTVYGVGKYLKENVDDVRVYALVPWNSYAEEFILHKRNYDEELLEGFSYHRINMLFQRAMDEGVIDEIIAVISREAIEGMRLLAEHGIAAGPTSGANYYHAVRISKRCGKTVTIIADSILRYPHIVNRLF